MIETALILAAGRGSRLSPLTDMVPKPLVRVTDQSILSNALDSLERSGVKKVYIVTGYRTDNFKREYPERFRSLSIHYIENEIYDTSNSMYSLLLGLRSMTRPEDVIVLEGDVFFDLSTIQNVPVSEITWLGDSGITTMDGCYLKTRGGVVHGIEILKRPVMNQENRYTYLKSAGILTFQKDLLPDIIKMLERAVDEGKTSLYYDLIFSQNLQNMNIRSLDIKGHKWFEIDTMEDLEMCREIFKDQ